MIGSACRDSSESRLSTLAENTRYVKRISSVLSHDCAAGLIPLFLGKADIPSEEVLWKELLVFFMNTKETSGYLRFLRGIEPLNFDPGLVADYLDCFHSESARADVTGELETLYEDVEDKKYAH
jgi:hypothetical protein